MAQPSDCLDLVGRTPSLWLIVVGLAVSACASEPTAKLVRSETLSALMAPVQDAMEIEPRALLPFTDGKYWAVLQPIVYQVAETTATAAVPRGFVSDLASIPQWVWSFGLAPTGRYMNAAILHDYLYWSQMCARDQADRIFLMAMVESKVPWLQRSLIYRGVSWGGQHAWNMNATNRRDGVKRFLPEPVLSSALLGGPSVREWQPIQRKLDSKVPEPVPRISPNFCGAADATAAR